MRAPCPEDHPPSLPRQAAPALIVPPVAPLRWPSLGVHALAAAAPEPVEVFYASHSWAQAVGNQIAEHLANPPGTLVIGERLFARAAHGGAPFGGPLALEGPGVAEWLVASGLDVRALDALEAATFAWVERHAQTLIDFPLLGFSVSFEQLNAALALARAVRRLRPKIPLWLGGAAATGDQASGIYRLDVFDAVFSGEAELSFAQALLQWRQDGVGPVGVVSGNAPALHALPVPDMTSWYRSVQAYFPEWEASRLWVCAETSRGCAWGKCLFCGLDGANRQPRALPPALAAARVREIAAQTPVGRVLLTDNLLPAKTREALLQTPVFAELRPGFGFTNAREMAAAGWQVQVGIEALSTSILARLRKGSRLSAVLLSLRAAREAALPLAWNLLTEIPDDTEEEWEAVLALLPAIAHLPPPQTVSPLRLDRFAPLAEEGHPRETPEGWRAAIPHPAVDQLCPWWASSWAAASRNPRLAERIENAVRDWRGAAQRNAALHLRGVRGVWTLTDTRSVPKVLHLTEELARALLSPSDAHAGWLTRSATAVYDEGWIPLATASPEARQEIEKNAD